MKTILILGADTRNGLAAAGALQGNGYRLIGLGVSSNSGMLRFIQKHSKPVVLDEMIFVQKYPEKQIDRFINELSRIIINTGADVLVPTGTHYTIWISEFRNSLPDSCVLPIEAHDKIQSLHDKFRVMKLCESMGIPTPETLLIEDRATLEWARHAIEYPAILKTRKGAATKGVWIVNSAEELERTYLDEIEKDVSGNTRASDRSKPMLQELIRGELHDVTSFSVRGQPRAVLSQIRLMTAPLTGGGGVVNQTTDVPEIKEMAEAIIRKVEWDGILEFDFIIDSQSSKPRLLEINPKIWGTTWLTVQAGYNMPLYMVKQALGEPYEIPNEYTVGLRGRWPSLERSTWTERPVTVGLYLSRVWHYIKLFADRNMVYDLRLQGFRAIVGGALTSLLIGTYRVLIRSRSRADDLKTDESLA